MRKMWFSVLILAGIVFTVFVSGCAGGFSRKGTIVPIEEPARKARAEALIQYNKATELLAATENNGKIDAGKLEKAITAYKEAKRLNPNDPDTHKQLGIIYEFFKGDQKTAYTYYKKYKELGGKDAEILETVKDLSQKYESGTSRPPQD